MPLSAKQSIRVYADTSVYGGVFDESFANASSTFFDLRDRAVSTRSSPLIRTEIEAAPQQVKDFVASCEDIIELVAVDEEARRLRKAYLDAGIVGQRWSADALHVALATISACRVIVSWNFRHIVHFQKIPLYNGINQSLGYAPIAIHSPEEVILSEE